MLGRERKRHKGDRSWEKQSPKWCPEKHTCGSQDSFSRPAWEPSWSHKHCGMSLLRVQSWPSTSHFNWVTLNVHYKSAIDSLSKLAETMTEGLQAH